MIISADRHRINAGNIDLAFITVSIAGKNGITVPDANNKVRFNLEGPGELVATDNGDPASLVSFTAKEKEAYSGLVLAIVRSEKGKRGTIKITASSPGLKTTSIDIKSY